MLLCDVLLALLAVGLRRQRYVKPRQVFTDVHGFFVSVRIVAASVVFPVSNVWLFFRYSVMFRGSVP